MTQNATWCQNRGCICISSVRRTYGRIHIPATIILWTELFPKKRREKIQGEILQSIFKYSGVSTFYKNYSVSTRNPAFLQVFQSSCAKKTILHTELILLQEFSKKYYNYKAHPVQINTRHLPATVPRVSKHSTRQNKAPGFPTSIPGPYSTSRLPAILPSRNSILCGSQHPRTPYSSSQAKNSTRRNRIHSKGLSIVCPYNTKVSVFQITY